MPAAKLNYQGNAEGMKVELTAGLLSVYGYGHSRYEAENDLRRELQRLASPRTPFVSKEMNAVATLLLKGFEKRRIDA